MNHRTIFIGTAIVGLFLFMQAIFGAPRMSASSSQFTVPKGSTLQSISDTLESQGFVRSSLAFHIFFHIFDDKKTIAPGGYYLSSSMNAWTVARILTSPSAMKWVTIPEGLRKEEIADIIASALDWSSSTEATFISDTNVNPDRIEGVYFPDTYLIPTDATPQDVVTELLTEFNKKFQPYAQKALNQNTKWTTALTLASIIQREAGSVSDMPLISGILWNRLDQKMALGVDSTIQYARGNTGKGYWAPITSADKQIVSLFNTYTHVGIPPHPISNPGIAAISAALSPATTTCMYYIHDKNRQIHCANTLDEQEINIAKYLK